MGYKPAADAPLVPLSLNMEGCETEEKLSLNIASALARRYVRFNEYVCSQSGRINVCGFGPSLTNTYKSIRGDVLACNGAHDYLIDNGIVPKWTMFMDAAEVITKMVTPHKDVTYFVASRCHPALFEHLRGFNVVVWHCAGDAKALELLASTYTQALMEPLVNGGTACVTRGMVLVRAMGYEEIHLYGADSSYEGEFTHVKKSLVQETELQVFAEGRWFKTTPWLAGQVEDIKILFPELIAGGARFLIHGDGLLPHVAKAIGYETTVS